MCGKNRQNWFLKSNLLPWNKLDGMLRHPQCLAHDARARKKIPPHIHIQNKQTKKYANQWWVMNFVKKTKKEMMRVHNLLCHYGRDEMNDRSRNPLIFLFLCYWIFFFFLNKQKLSNNNFKSIDTHPIQRKDDWIWIKLSAEN